MRYYAPLAVMLLLIGASGFVHGVMTDRWGMPPDVKGAAAKLENVPAVIGDWQSVEVPMNPRELEIAEAVGHLSRRYTNRADGRVVDVLIVCGRPGPIAVHPPTVCFTGAGFALQSYEEDVLVRPEGSAAVGRFCIGDFVKQSGGGVTQMRTFWAWSADGKWQTPSNPRMTFAREPHLYKMYLTRSLRDLDESADEDPLADFMRVFMPALNKTLFGKA